MDQKADCCLSFCPCRLSHDVGFPNSYVMCILYSRDNASKKARNPTCFAVGRATNSNNSAACAYHCFRCTQAHVYPQRKSKRNPLFSFYYIISLIDATYMHLYFD